MGNTLYFLLKKTVFSVVRNFKIPSGNVSFNGTGSGDFPQNGPRGQEDTVVSLQDLARVMGNIGKVYSMITTLRQPSTVTGLPV